MLCPDRKETGLGGAEKYNRKTASFSVKFLYIARQDNLVVETD